VQGRLTLISMVHFVTLRAGGSYFFHVSPTEPAR
jgi:hypothetical protein